MIYLAPDPLVLGAHVPIPEHPVLHVSLSHIYVLTAPFDEDSEHLEEFLLAVALPTEYRSARLHLHLRVADWN